jgi:hypothetical protein
MSDRIDAEKECDLDEQKLVKVTNQIIRIPFDTDQYEESILDPSAFRAHLSKIFEESPELFPKRFAEGYLMKDMRLSQKIYLTKENYSEF